MQRIEFNHYPFEQLSALDIYQIGQLRQQVFIIEQNCNYLDFDGRDLQSWHLLGENDKGELVAYCRILPAGLVYPDDVCIGRVVNRPDVRGRGIGRKLMEKGLEICQELYGNVCVRISAQDYLLDFYQSLGFIATEHKYLEDNLPHTEMYLPAQ